MRIDFEFASQRIPEFYNKTKAYSYPHGACSLMREMEINLIIAQINVKLPMMSKKWKECCVITTFSGEVGPGEPPLLQEHGAEIPMTYVGKEWWERQRKQHV